MTNARPNTMVRIRIPFCVIVAFCVAVLALCVAGLAPAAEENVGLKGASSKFSKFVAIEKVIDGDTITIGGGEKVRYIGIDTPEKGEAGYRKATEANRKLCVGKSARIEICQARPLDKYGRTLAAVFVGDIDVTRRLLRRGLGRVFTDSSCLTGRRAQEYWTASRSAYVEGLGIWKASRGAVSKPEDAQRLIGRHALVRGIVKNVHVGEKAVHINFGDDWKTDFSATIFKDAKELFSSKGLGLDQSLTGKQVSVFGYIGRYNGPNIILHSPAQVTVE